MSALLSVPSDPSVQRPRPPLRAAITAAYRRSEPDCVLPLLSVAEQAPDAAARIAAVARQLVLALRAKAGSSGVEGLIHEYALSSQEGVALMCLAEALLRIPDLPTRDALIRDKISRGDWKSHVGHSPSLFVNAATWGLVVTGKLTSTNSETSLAASLARLISRGGEPLIRRGVDIAMRMMGEQFVMGQTIEEALDRSRRMEARGFRYSYDMLGEAAMTAADAAHYLAQYEAAIHAIGMAAAGRGVIQGSGISIKLSALHPRYTRAQIGRVRDELLPRLKTLCRLARRYNIGLNIDAEEADRLEISLDLLEALATDPDLSGWDGLGFVIQAYGKRCPAVIDWMVDLARRADRRIMVRLVKGAYWDSEIKRAQVDGMPDFPVFTRKVHTDVSYIACARKLLAARDAVFPQFATHNCQTLATILEMAGPDYSPDAYEFQCLHGMGEALYDEVVGPEKLARPCRIYAPVGTHETLLAYLVRRLLENGANSSFVHGIADLGVSVEDLIADPVAVARMMPAPGTPHERIALPRDLYGPERRNSRGLDLTDEDSLAVLSHALDESRRIRWHAAPTLAAGPAPDDVTVVNPADYGDVVGYVRFSCPEDIARAVRTAEAAASAWNAVGAERRAAMLRKAADLFEARMPLLIGLISREAGKTLPNAIGEVREAVDFLRYYAGEAVQVLGAERREALGPVLCISPWNFPLAIFTGQVAAALAAGNPVLAKPAEETPLIAAEAVRLMHEASIPEDVLQLVPGDGEVGAALVADARVMAVIFTGSTAVARLIQRQLASRLSPGGRPIPLIAETGGINALVVDSSALPEQVVGDVLSSAFDSAGQRCSALRILCVQDDVADRVIAMLKGAMDELALGRPDRLSTDVGPVITAEARDGILRHIEAMRARGHAIHQLRMSPETQHGTFVPPTLIEVAKVADVEREVFGPVLHVLRFRREDLDRVVADVNVTGYGLTFGLHTRIDESVARVVSRAEAGNVYVNRNIIGAVVGVQPFGGSGLSGTGPKAGGPLYLRRLFAAAHEALPPEFKALSGALATARLYADWLRETGCDQEAERVLGYLSRSALGAEIEFPGPVGERNLYALRPRGRVAALGRSPRTLLVQLGAILATGNVAVVPSNASGGLPAELPPALRQNVVAVSDPADAPALGAVLADLEGAELIALQVRLAERDGPILPVQSLTEAALAAGEDYDLDRLLEEVSVSTNTAAAGGNASLMSVG